MYALPSMSTSWLPAPWSMNGGTPPTARNARTGLFTPPGMTLRAASNAAADFSVDRDFIVSLIWWLLWGDVVVCDVSHHVCETSTGGRYARDMALRAMSRTHGPGLRQGLIRRIKPHRAEDRLALGG